MANLSDVIEEFLIELMGKGSAVSISRNELATYFAVAPSQINYVLATRFTPDRGFLIESRRGGGGFISLSRVNFGPENLLRQLLTLDFKSGLTHNKVVQILERMSNEGIITENEARLLGATMSDKSLLAPAVVKDSLRAGIIKGIAAELLRPQEK